MLRKLKGLAGDIYRGFQGVYQDRRDHKVIVPDGLKEIIIGESVEGRELFAYQFGEQANIKILFMGGIHGNEIGTIKLMYKLIGHLVRNRYLGLKIFVLPCLNPDGMALALEQPDYFGGGRPGRLNSNGVDLNRNFEVQSFETENYWYFGNEYVSVSCGNKPFSEPESRALADFLKQEDISIIYSFHSRGREVMGSCDKLAQTLTRNFVEKSAYRYIDDEQWRRMQQTGTLKEWCEKKGIAYIEVESSTRWGSDWKNQKDAIISALKYHYG